LQTQVELARDLGFAPQRQANEIVAEAAEISSMVNGFLSTLRRNN
jgi:four helix bundle protein